MSRKEQNKDKNIAANQETSPAQELVVQQSAQDASAQQPTQESLSQDTDLQSTQEALSQDTDIQPTQEPTTQDTAARELSQELLPQDTIEQSTQDTSAQQSAQDSVPQYYVVRKGDTLQTICFNVYGDYSHVEEICRWNNIETQIIFFMDKSFYFPENNVILYLFSDTRAVTELCERLDRQ